MASDYERYIHTGELLGLQKGSADLINHDELLFQVTHQAAELWMKAALHDLSEAERLMLAAAGQERPPAVSAGALSLRYPPLGRAVTLIQRAAGIIVSLTDQIRILEGMAPADYHQIRLALGRGSGQDSPGFNRLLAMATPLEAACRALFHSRGVTAEAILGDPYGEGELHALVQALLELDEEFSRFRQAHLHLVRRQIGLDVKSLKGVPAAKLVAGTQAAMFPALWDAVSALTNSLNPGY